MENDKELVHDAYLEVMSDPEKYTEWQYTFVDDLELKFKSGIQTTLSVKQRTQIENILKEN